MNEYVERRDVPVAVVEDDDVRSRQVDTQTTRTRRKQEDELLAIRLVILVDREDTIVVSCSTINPAIFYNTSQLTTLKRGTITHCIDGTDNNPPIYLALGSSD